MLTEQEKLDYLQNVVIPVFKPLDDSNCRMAILNFNTQLAWMSNAMSAYIQRSGYKEEHVNKISSKEVTADFVEKFCKAHNINTEIFINVTQQMNGLIRQVIESKNTINFVVLLPFIKTFHGYARTAAPILHPNGEVVGVQVIGYEYSFFGIQEFISLLHTEKYESKKYYHEQDQPELNKRGLSPRQKEILFLVGQGLSQDYAAQILGIKRGTLSKIITDQICPKFDIFPPHYIKLLEAVKNEGLDRHIPESFWQPRVIKI
ncbi:MAG: hypothetical protein QG673_947 [Pseudomonadota bacterium]|nr:hypothetical protein [Pseudomonadota bacterium]